MPWANDGGNSWNATKCSPLDPNPMKPGEECIVEGSGVSGVDNCDAAAMCWDVNPETNEGVCIAFCSGSEQSPVCDDPGTCCGIYNDGVLILCLPACDPLLQDCPVGQGCYAYDWGMVCVPDASGPEGPLPGAPCEYANVCGPGLQCIDAQYVPGCAGAVGCCAPFCDVGAQDPYCNAGAGEECVPLWEEGEQPPCKPEHIGVCRLPP
jgi:hypothetical protein